MNDDLIAALNAERYGTPGWFTSPERTTTTEADVTFDDSDIATARRRRLLAAEYAASTKTNTNRHTA